MALGYDGCIRLPNCSGDHDSVHEMIYGGVSILMTVHSIDKTPFADKNGKKKHRTSTKSMGENGL